MYILQRQQNPLQINVSNKNIKIEILQRQQNPLQTNVSNKNIKRKKRSNRQL